MSLPELQLGTEETCFKLSAICKVLLEKPQIPATSATDRSESNGEKNARARLADKNRRKPTRFKELSHCKAAEALLHLFMNKTVCITCTRHQDPSCEHHWLQSHHVIWNIYFKGTVVTDDTGVLQRYQN